MNKVDKFDEEVAERYKYHYGITDEEFEQYTELHEKTLAYATVRMSVAFRNVAREMSKSFLDMWEVARIANKFFPSEVEQHRIRKFNRLNYSKKKSQQKNWKKYKKRGR